MKTFLMALGLLALNGCATAITSYNVKAGYDCPPQVLADTSIGISIKINDDLKCHKTDFKHTEKTGGTIER